MSYPHNGRPVKPSWLSPAKARAIIFAIIALTIAALCALQGCAYSFIPTASLERAKDATEVIVDEGQRAGQRAADYKAAGNPEAAAEADRMRQVGEYAGVNIGKPLNDGQPVGETVMPAIVAAAQANPWTAGIVAVIGALVPVMGGYAAVKARQASHADAAHEWEERIASDPSYGPPGTINFDAPEVKARALADAATGKLKPGALRRLYPQG